MEDNAHLRDSALSIFRAALDAADPRAAIHRAMRREGNRLRVREREYDLNGGRRVFIIGFGKASAARAVANAEVSLARAGLRQIALSIQDDVLVAYGEALSARRQSFFDWEFHS